MAPAIGSGPPAGAEAERGPGRGTATGVAAAESAPCTSVTGWASREAVVVTTGARGSRGVCSTGATAVGATATVGLTAVVVVPVAEPAPFWSGRMAPRAPAAGGRAALTALAPVETVRAREPGRGSAGTGPARTQEQAGAHPLKRTQPIPPTAATPLRALRQRPRGARGGGRGSAPSEPTACPLLPSVKDSVETLLLGRHSM